MNFDWDRGEGFGWREGHWDRDWGNAHWRSGDRGDLHGDHDRGRGAFHRDHGEHRGDRDDQDR